MPPMRPPLLLVALLAGPLPALAGCTALVVDDLLADEIPCEAPGDCAAGFSCAEGFCEPADDPSSIPAEGTTVGPEGGDVAGPDGVELAVPAGALPTDTALVIERASATNVAVGCTEASAFYRVSPVVNFAVGAVLTIPVDDCADCVICAKPAEDGDWAALDEPAVAPSDSAAAILTQTGNVLVAGVPQ